jgi:hypothetical protein
LDALGKTSRLANVIQAIEGCLLGVSTQVADARGEEIGIEHIGSHQTVKQLLYRQETDGVQLLLATSDLRKDAQCGAQHIPQYIDDLHALGSRQGRVRAITTDAHRMTDEVQLL